MPVPLLTQPWASWGEVHWLWIQESHSLTQQLHTYFIPDTVLDDKVFCSVSALMKLLFEKMINKKSKKKILQWIQTDYHAKWSKTRSTNTTWNHLYVESKIWHKWTYPQNRLTDTGEQTCGCRKWGVGHGGSGMDWKFGVNRYKLLHLQWIDKKVLLYSTGNYIKSPGIDHDRK